MIDWYTAAQVTATNGSDIVVVNSGEAIDAIRTGDGLRVDGFAEVQIIDAFTDGVTGNEVIRLKANWPHATQTLVSATVIPHAVHFNTAAQALVDTKTKVFAQLSSFFAFGTQASGTVTFTAISELNPDVTVRCINQWDTDLTALENQAQGAVDDVNAIDTQVNGAGGLVEVVDGIDATLQGYVTSASSSANASLTHSNTAKGYRDTAKGYHDNTLGYKNTTEGYYNSVNTWQAQVSTDKNTTLGYKNLALQFRDEAEAFKDQAGAIVGGDFVTTATKVNGKELSSDITLDATDIGIQTALDEIEALAIIGL